MDTGVNISKEYEETIEKLKNLKAGNIIRGKIIHVNEKEVLVDIGYKSEGVIPISEFRKKGKKTEIKTRDEIDVLLLDKEDGEGRMLLSHKRAVTILAWRRILQAFERNEAIEGVVVDVRKDSDGKIAGFAVDVDGIRGFLPFSASGLEKQKEFNHIVGKTIELKIIELDQKKHDVIFSRKALLEEKREKQKELLFKSLRRGEIREGVVNGLTEFGVFVDLGGVDGLIHLKDLSWGRKKPEEVLKKGERIKVMILDFNKEEGKISLGFRQLKPDPWEKVEEKYPIGKRVKGKVVKVAPFGIFVELEEGIDGLVRLEDLSWKRTIKHPSEIAKEGDELELMVIFLNKKDRKLALGLKQVQPDPWILLAQKYPPGTPVKGKIVKLAPFGAFLRLEDGIDGLIRIKDISWIKKVKHPSEIFSVGKEADAVVLNVDVGNKKIALGVKQLFPSPWDKYRKGTLVQGRVIKMDDFGVSIELEEGIEGFVHVSELSKEYVNKPQDVVSIGQTLDLKVIKVDQKQKKIEMSLKQFLVDKEKDEITSFINSQEKDKLTLGDFFKK